MRNVLKTIALKRVTCVRHTVVKEGDAGFKVSIPSEKV